MPVKKGKGCVGDVMKEWKRGDLHSGTGKKGKKGKVVRSQDQAIAIALNTCNNNEMDDQKFMCGPDCECSDCGARSKKKKSMMALGYNEDAAEALVTELMGPEFSEDITPMLVARLRVIVGRCNEILQVLDHAHMSAKMGGGEVEMDQWMVDKITMAADYLSAVADNSKFGGGVKVEGDESPYSEGHKKAFKTGKYGKGLSEKQEDSAIKSSKKAMKADEEGKSLKEQYKPWPSDKAYNKKMKDSGKKIPKSKHTKKYEQMYGKDGEDHSEDTSDFKKGGGAGKALAEKARKSGISLGVLRKVYQRGIGAWKTGHRPGMSPQQWAMARVNSFITGGGARKADKDLLGGSKTKPTKTKRGKKGGVSEQT